MTTQVATQTLISGGYQAQVTNAFTASQDHRAECGAAPTQAALNRRNAGVPEFISISEEDFYPWFRANAQRLLRVLRAHHDDPAAMEMVRAFVLENEGQARQLLEEAAAHPTLRQAILALADTYRPEEEYQIQAEFVVTRQPAHANGHVPAVTPLAAGGVTVH